MKKNLLKNLPIVLLTAAIALSPSFSAGEIEGGRVVEIRAEDILIVILGLVWIVNFLISGRKKIEKPPLFFPILAWLAIGFFSTLTNWISVNIPLARGFFFFLKEIEFFFLYFYLFYHIKTIDSAKFIVKIWIFLGLVNVGWVVFQMIGGFVGPYGPSAIVEPMGPFPSSGFFLMLFVFLFNILLYYYLKMDISNFKKGILTVVTIGPAIGVISSGSRTSGIGLIFSLFLIILLYFVKEKKGFKPFLISIFALILISFSFIFLSSRVPGIERSLSISSLQEGISQQLSTRNPIARINFWKDQFFEISKRPLFLFFGMGKSVQKLHEESHNQFVRNFIETGIIGSFAFLLLLFLIIKKAFQGFLLGKNPFSVGLSSGLLVATLTMLIISITADAFIVVKIAEVYWFFTALTMAVLTFNKQIYVN